MGLNGFGERKEGGRVLVGWERNGFGLGLAWAGVNEIP